jgi:tetratricopeptide (TPR) repeat protein
LSEHNQKTTFRQKVILIVIGFFFTLIILEVGLRLGGFIATSLQERRNKISIRKKGAYRILCLGESTTAGQYPPFLEEELNSRNIGIKFSVIDKGVNGAITPTILAKLESNLDAYHPDMVITMMGLNDYGPHMPPEFTIRNQKPITFWQSLRVYKLAKLLWLHLTTRLWKTGLSRRNNQPKPLSSQNNPQRTEAELKQAIALNPKKHSAFVDLARFYRNQDRLREAEAIIKQAIALNIKKPTVYLAYAELARCYRKLGKLSEAERVLKQAIAIEPKWPSVYMPYAELARFYQDQGRLSEAEEVLRQATRLNFKEPTVYLVYAGLVRFYRETGRLADAEETFRQAAALDTKRSSLHVVYAELVRFYRETGRLSEAEEVFKQAIALNPREGRLLYRALKLLYAEMVNPVFARDYDNKIQESGLVNYGPVTVDNYRKLKAILDKRSIVYICVQYPMRNSASLKKIFPDGAENIVFVDNEEIFMNAVVQGRYEDYFRDMFGGDFGHCTDKGNRLLAENIANVILREVFSK